MAKRVTQRTALAQQARVNPEDLDDFAAKGWLGRHRSEFFPPDALPIPFNVLGLSETDTASVLELVGQKG